VIQKGFDVADDVTNPKLISELEGSDVKCGKDNYGVHCGKRLASTKTLA
jgi:hypothetical protein